MEENVKAPFWKPALIYGLVLGIVSVFLQLVFYFLGLSQASWTGYVIMLVMLVLLIYLMIQYRTNYLGGYATFGQIFLMVLVSAGIVATIITTLYTYVLHTVIDPGLLEQTKIAAEERIMNNSRVPENMYDDIFERMEKTMQLPYLIKMSLILNPVLQAIVGLIVAAFLKKEEDINMPA